MVALGVATLVAAACDASPAPRLASVEPAVLCDGAEGATVRVSGEGLGPVVVDALGTPTLLGPSFRLEPVSGLAEGSDAGDLAPVEIPGDSPALRFVDDTTVEIDVGPALGVAPGTWALVAVAPDGTEARLSPALSVAGPPTVDAVDPVGVCHDLDEATVTVVGDGFLVLDGALPTVTVGGEPATVAPGDCAPLAAPAVGEVCTTLLATVAPGPLALGEAAVAVTNPAPADCASAAPAAVDVVRPPEATAVEPAWLCTTGGSFVVEGSGFTESATVDLGDVPVAGVTWLDAGHLQVELGDGATAGVVDVTVVDGGGCTATLPAALTLVGPPLVYAVEPAVAWSGAPLVVVAKVANVAGTLVDAWLVSPDGVEVDVPWTWDAAAPGEVRLSVPAGLAEGAWSVEVAEEGSCDGQAAATLTVVGTPTVSVAEVDPPFAWTYDATSVEVRGEDPAPNGQVGFGDPPQVYLVGPDGTVERARGVARRDEASLRAIVPERLAAGAWDVLVVNPDGAMGWLEDGLVVTQTAPPAIDSVAPVRLDKTSDETLTIRGHDFDDPTVALVCSEGGVETTAPVEVLAWDYGTVDALVPASTFSAAVCVVEVTNADGAAARWSALSIANPSANLFAWSAGPELVEARRAPAAAAGRTTSVTRYVYAIGGDAGDAASAYASVEVSAMGVYGSVGAWSLLPRSLPEARTLAGVATIGRFVYLIGGDDGAGATDAVLRAAILDPLDAPWFEAVAVEPAEEDGQGLGPGTWSWRVAARFSPTDAANPGGESQAGDVLTLTLPDVGTPWVPTLSWTPVDGAVGYRVYRSPAADLGGGAEEWVADVDGATTFADDGAATDPTVLPLGDGALGEWATLPPLGVPRASPCIAVGEDPRTDPVLRYVYAAGGFDASGEPLDSIEYLPIVVESDAVQTVDDWIPSARTLSTARAECGGYGVDATLHDLVEPGETWVLFAGGTDGSRARSEVDAGRVGEGGELEDWQETETMNPARAGFATLSASDTLYAFGGQGGAPSTSGTSAELDLPLPTLGNWNSLGTSLAEARHLPGSAQESAVVVVIGGQTDTAAATRTVDTTNY